MVADHPHLGATIKTMIGQAGLSEILLHDYKSLKKRFLLVHRELTEDHISGDNRRKLIASILDQSSKEANMTYTEYFVRLTKSLVPGKSTSRSDRPLRDVSDDMFLSSLSNIAADEPRFSDAVSCLRQLAEEWAHRRVLALADQLAEKIQLAQHRHWDEQGKLRRKQQLDQYMDSSYQGFRQRFDLVLQKNPQG